MAENSKIEWTDHTANLVWGCNEVHEGCDNCYARYFANTRYKHDVWGNDKPRKIIKSFFSNLDKFQRLAKAANQNHRVFVGSMFDIFEKPMPVVLFDETPVIFENRQMTTEDLRRKLFQRISDGLYNNLIFLFLTKRPSNINKYIPEHWKNSPPDNVMFGTSPVNQATFDNLVPHLLKVNGKRFLSMEPQLAPIKIGGLKGIDWIIQGGESGKDRRPFNLEWADSMREQCARESIPYFFKQIDKVTPVPEPYLIRQLPEFLKPAA